jgi:hypothetical protein
MKSELRETAARILKDPRFHWLPGMQADLALTEGSNGNTHARVVHVQPGRTVCVAFQGGRMDLLMSSDGDIGLPDLEDPVTAAMLYVIFDHEPPDGVEVEVIGVVDSGGQER